MNKIKKIDQLLMRSLFTYDCGHLIRNESNTTNVPGKRIGWIDKNGYVIIDINKKKYRAHRIIWTMFNGEIPSGYFIDHINGVRTDNRIENLRLALVFENSQNVKKCHSDSKTGELGVTYDKSRTRSKYKVQIMLLGKKKVKYFLTLKEAKDFYLETKRKIHEFNTL